MYVLFRLKAFNKLTPVNNLNSLYKPNREKHTHQKKDKVKTDEMRH